MNSFRLRALVPALAVLAMLASVGVARSDGPAAFMTEMADIPLMPGLAEVEGAGMAFDDAAGRIVESYAGGMSTRAAVLDFYDRTLPQLGWEGAGDAGTFRREDEVLRLEFIEDGEGIMVRFFLSPAEN
jgi:hypothetical protein